MSNLSELLKELNDAKRALSSLENEKDEAKVVMSLTFHLENLKTAVEKIRVIDTKERPLSLSDDLVYNQCVEMFSELVVGICDRNTNTNVNVKLQEILFGIFENNPKFAEPLCGVLDNKKAKESAPIANFLKVEKLAQNLQHAQASLLSKNSKTVDLAIQNLERNFHAYQDLQDQGFKSARIDTLFKKFEDACNANPKAKSKLDAAKQAAMPENDFTQIEIAPEEELDQDFTHIEITSKEELDFARKYIAYRDEENPVTYAALDALDTANDNLRTFYNRPTSSTSSFKKAYLAWSENGSDANANALLEASKALFEEQQKEVNFNKSHAPKSTSPRAPDPRAVMHTGGFSDLTPAKTGAAPAKASVSTSTAAASSATSPIFKIPTVEQFKPTFERDVRELQQNVIKFLDANKRQHRSNDDDDDNDDKIDPNLLAEAKRKLALIKGQLQAANAELARIIAAAQAYTVNESDVEILRNQDALLTELYESTNELINSVNALDNQKGVSDLEPLPKRKSLTSAEIGIGIPQASGAYASLNAAHKQAALQQQQELAAQARALAELDEDGVVLGDADLVNPRLVAKPSANAVPADVQAARQALETAKVEQSKHPKSLFSSHATDEARNNADAEVTRAETQLWNTLVSRANHAMANVEIQKAQHTKNNMPAQKAKIELNQARVNLESAESLQSEAKKGNLATLQEASQAVTKARTRLQTAEVRVAVAKAVAPELTEKQSEFDTANKNWLAAKDGRTEAEAAHRKAYDAARVLERTDAIAANQTRKAADDAYKAAATQENTAIQAAALQGAQLSQLVIAEQSRVNQEVEQRLAAVERVAAVPAISDAELEFARALVAFERPQMECNNARKEIQLAENELVQLAQQSRSTGTARSKLIAPLERYQFHLNLYWKNPSKEAASNLATSLDHLISEAQEFKKNNKVNPSTSAATSTADSIVAAEHKFADSLILLDNDQENLDQAEADAAFQAADEKYQKSRAHTVFDSRYDDVKRAAETLRQCQKAMGIAYLELNDAEMANPKDNNKVSTCKEAYKEAKKAAEEAQQAVYSAEENLFAAAHTIVNAHTTASAAVPPAAPATASPTSSATKSSFWARLTAKSTTPDSPAVAKAKKDLEAALREWDTADSELNKAILARNKAYESTSTVAATGAIAKTHAILGDADTAVENARRRNANAMTTANAYEQVLDKIVRSEKLVADRDAALQAKIAAEAKVSDARNAQALATPGTQNKAAKAFDDATTNARIAEERARLTSEAANQMLQEIATAKSEAERLAQVRNRDAQQAAADAQTRDDARILAAESARTRQLDAARIAEARRNGFTSAPRENARLQALRKNLENAVQEQNDANTVRARVLPTEAQKTTLKRTKDAVTIAESELLDHLAPKSEQNDINNITKGDAAKRAYPAEKALYKLRIARENLAKKIKASREEFTEADQSVKLAERNLRIAQAVSPHLVAIEADFNQAKEAARIAEIDRIKALEKHRADYATAREIEATQGPAQANVLRDAADNDYRNAAIKANVAIKKAADYGEQLEDAVLNENQLINRKIAEADREADARAAEAQRMAAERVAAAAARTAAAEREAAAASSAAAERAAAAARTAASERAAAITEAEKVLRAAQSNRRNMDDTDLGARTAAEKEAADREVQKAQAELNRLKAERDAAAAAAHGTASPAAAASTLPDGTAGATFASTGTPAAASIPEPYYLAQALRNDIRDKWRLDAEVKTLSADADVALTTPQKNMCVESVKLSERSPAIDINNFDAAPNKARLEFHMNSIIAIMNSRNLAHPTDPQQVYRAFVLGGKNAGDVQTLWAIMQVARKKLTNAPIEDTLSPEAKAAIAKLTPAQKTKLIQDVEQRFDAHIAANPSLFAPEITDSINRRPAPAPAPDATGVPSSDGYAGPTIVEEPGEPPRRTGPTSGT